MPTVTALQGAAERIPLADGSDDAVTAGQAFHWFRHDEALAEVHRVLRTGGGVALLWNNRDQDDRLQRAVTDLTAPFVPTGRPASYDSSRFLADSTLFGPIEERTFCFAQQLDTETLVGRVLSISFIAAASADARAELERRIRDLAGAAGGKVVFPYVTSVYVSRAV